MTIWLDRIHDTPAAAAHVDDALQYVEDSSAASGDAATRLEGFVPALREAIASSEPITAAALAALIDAHGTGLGHREIAPALGVSTEDLVRRLRQAAVRVIGVTHAREGDLILEINDGRRSESDLIAPQVHPRVVRRAFGPLVDGGPRCLGIRDPSETYVHNMWENTDIRDPGRAEVVLVRGVR